MMRLKLNENDIQVISHVFYFATGKPMTELKLRRLDYIYFLSKMNGVDKSGFFSSTRDKKGYYNPYLTCNILTIVGPILISILEKDEPYK